MAGAGSLLMIANGPSYSQSLVAFSKVVTSAVEVVGLSMYHTPQCLINQPYMSIMQLLVGEESMQDTLYVHWM